MPTPDPSAADANAPDSHDDEPGDPACWLHRVCAACGAFRTDPDAPCWRCGGTP